MAGARGRDPPPAPRRRARAPPRPARARPRRPARASRAWRVARQTRGGRSRRRAGGPASRPRAGAAACGCATRAGPCDGWRSRYARRSFMPPLEVWLRREKRPALGVRRPGTVAVSGEPAVEPVEEPVGERDESEARPGRQVQLDGVEDDEQRAPRRPRGDHAQTRLGAERLETLARVAEVIAGMVVGDVVLG